MMEIQVASKPPVPPGLVFGSNSQGTGSNPKKKREQEQKFLNSGSLASSIFIYGGGSSNSNRRNSNCNCGGNGNRSYGDHTNNRFQGHRYGLSRAFVCFSAKIHDRYSSPSQDDKSKSHSVRSTHSRESLSRHQRSQVTQTKKHISHEFPSSFSDCKITLDISSEHQGSRSQHMFDAVQDPYMKLPVHLCNKPRGNELCWNYIKSLGHRRGLSQVTLEKHHAHRLEIVDHQNLPPEFSHKIVEAITSYHESSVESNHSSSTITEEEIASSSPSIIQDLCGTGNTTERSSVDSQYSWDECDHQSAKKVQNCFDEIDSFLFERRNHQTDNIYKECQEWGSLFPHLRVLGRQLFLIQELGYKVIERDPVRPSTTSSIRFLEVTDQDVQGLSISGQQVHAIVSPVEAHSHNSGTTSISCTEFSFLEEEVFESEGDYEEIIAIDYKDIYEDNHENKKQLTPRRRRVAYPPITPNACFKDSVVSSAFDCMWQEVISWIRPLLKKYTDVILETNKPIVQALQMIPQQNDSTPSILSRENSNIRNLLGVRAQTMIESRALYSPKLDGVLQISRKIPIQRENTQIPVDASDMEISVTTNRPASSILLGAKNRPLSRYGSRGRGIRLTPIHNIADRSKTPSMDEERVPYHPASGALLVRKINPPGLTHLPSPLYNARNGALPPISSPTELETVSRLQIVPHFKKKMMVATRASSAIDKDLRVVFKDHSLNCQEARPSTTHAFRSETPQGVGRRSLTPFNSFAFNNLPTSRNSNFGTGGKHQDIRVNGFQMAHDFGQLANIPQEILEDTEGLEDQVQQNHWTPSIPSHNNSYHRRNHHGSSLVRL